MEEVKPWTEEEILERIRMVTRKLLDTSSVDQIVGWFANHTTEYRRELRTGLGELSKEPKYSAIVEALLAKLPPAEED